MMEKQISANFMMNSQLKKNVSSTNNLLLPLHQRDVVNVSANVTKAPFHVVIAINSNMNFCVN